MITSNNSFSLVKFKNLSFTILAIFLSLLVISCKDGFDTEVTRSLEFQLNLATGEETSTVNWNQEIDLLKDRVFNSYKDRLVAYKLEKITLTVNTLTPQEDVTLQGQLGFSESASANAQKIAGIDNLQLNDLNQEKEIDLDQNGITEFLKLLKDTNKGYIELQGDVSQVPVQAAITLKFYFVIVTKVI